MTMTAQDIRNRAQTLAFEAAALRARATTLHLGAVAQAVRDEHPGAHTIVMLHFAGDLNDDVPAEVQFTDEPDTILDADGEPIDDATVPDWAVNMGFDPDLIDSEDDEFTLTIDAALAAMDAAF